MRALRPLLLAVCAASAALAGCLDPEDGGPGSSAGDLLDAAEREAASWGQDARLWSIHGVEREGEAAWDDAAPSEKHRHVGDGEAPGWTYVFVTASGELRSVLAWMDGTVSASDDVALMGEGLQGVPRGVPLGPWSVDSDEAARRIAEAEPSFRERVQAGGMVRWALRGQAAEPTDATPEADAQGHGHEASPQNPAGAVWVATVGDAASNGTTYLVDAVDGAFLAVVPLEPALPDVPQEAGRMEGTLVAGDAIRGEPFRVGSEGHPRLTVRFSASTAGIVSVKVVGPDGETPVERWGPLPGDVQIDVPAPAPGDWSVDLRLDAGAAVPYEIEWCAAGLTDRVPQEC